jgi:hypothetical protein
MYYPNKIEEICFDQTHINSVWEQIQKHIPIYFQKYIDSEGGNSILQNEVEKLAAHFGASFKPGNKKRDSKKILERLLKEAIDNYENERLSYQEHLDLEALIEYGDDVSSFKNTILKNQIPIIRKTLQNRQAKELDKFRAAFTHAQPGDLFKVTFNIINLANDWRNDWYDEEVFEEIETCEDLNYHDLDGEEYTAFGVIGGGIKSHFIYKLFPEMYPSRSREAVWALYYLSGKSDFGCTEESEFLMINVKEGSTHQNFFYPYGLFAFYALKVFIELKKLYASEGVIIPTEYRFVAVDRFLSFVARSHQDEIDTLKQKSDSDYYDY